MIDQHRINGEPDPEFVALAGGLATATHNQRDWDVSHDFSD